MAVFSDDLTALLRRRAFSFCRLRFFCDLMFAMRKHAPVAVRMRATRTRTTVVGSRSTKGSAEVDASVETKGSNRTWNVRDTDFHYALRHRLLAPRRRPPAARAGPGAAPVS